MKTFLFLSFTAMILVPACTSTVGGAGTCTKDADCGTDQICGFPESDGCSAAGQCFPAPEALCQAFSPGCACDGTLITTVCTGLPEGFVRKPLAHTGECTDPGPDASTPCCPDGFILHDCTYPDGTPGQACNNPTLDCASSQICGQGCDMVVTGACDGG